MDILDKCKKCIFCKETSNTGDNYCDSLKFCVGFNQFISKENAVIIPSIRCFFTKNTFLTFI